jgi:lipoate---protein ligase
VRVEHQRTTVAELHADRPADLDRGATVRWCEPTDAAIVLGSRQSPDLLDAQACAARGLTIVRRRSGGAAVLIRPDAVVWIDIVVPHGIAPDDVRGSMIWAGHAWRAALGDIGAIDPAGTTIHEGGMVASAGSQRWCDLVCFAGIGPGEVLAAGGAKLVGLSQRRTRGGLRIQGMVHRRDLGDDIAAVFAGAVPDESPPAPATVGGLDPGALAMKLAPALASRITPA